MSMRNGGWGRRDVEKAQGCPFIRLPSDTRGKEPTWRGKRRKRYRCDPWVGKIPWRRAWQHTPVFLPGESPGQRSLVAASPRGLRVGADWLTSTDTEFTEWNQQTGDRCVTPHVQWKMGITQRGFLGEKLEASTLFFFFWMPSFCYLWSLWYTQKT